MLELNDQYESETLHKIQWDPYVVNGGSQA